MNIYKHKTNKNLYTIEHLILDIRHLNRNGFAGIYASPYNWKGETIKFNSQDNNKCNSFVEQNFEIVSYT